MTTSVRLPSTQYTVGWFCAIAESEFIAAIQMLDHRHPQPMGLDGYDTNVYECGDINGHNVVITCMPPAIPGIVSAQKMIQPLDRSFPNLQIHLFVGIGGGVPRRPPPRDSLKDIHLGDVVVGWPDKTGDPAVIAYHSERLQDGGRSELLRSLDKPSRPMINALNSMLMNREMNVADFSHNLHRLAGMTQFQHPGLETDVLFQPDFPHVTTGVNESDCSRCERMHMSNRPPRQNTEPQFHQGPILSGDTIMQNAQKRDELSEKYYNAICFEMEAAGLMDDVHCLVIRGISDYADGHKPSTWRHYAAATAAAFARELLQIVRPRVVAAIHSPQSQRQEINGSQSSTVQGNDTTAHIHLDSC